MSDVLRDKLRALAARREPAAQAEPRAVAEQASDNREFIRQRLARHAARQSCQGTGAASELTSTALDARSQESLAKCTEGPPAALEVATGPSGPYAFRRSVFEAHAPHGSEALLDLSQVESELYSVTTADPSLAELELGRAVFLDTETTGLSGGAGTYVFQVGLGTIEEGRFELWQGFLRGPEDEPAMLAEAARRIAAASAVVSFFGKSFDRHRLEDKMRMCGVEPPFANKPHLDLYHPLRRLYAGAFENCKLQTLERKLCGVEREDDLPGSMAPAAWFDYLAGRPHRLEGVFEHNAIDVLSLVRLGVHLGRCGGKGVREPMQAPGLQGTRLLGLVRSFAAHKDWRRVLELHEAHETLLRQGLDAPDDAHGEWTYWKVRAQVQTGQAAPALACCEEATRVGGWAPAVASEQAKLLEHHAKDRAAALGVVEAALACRSACSSGAARHWKDLELRQTRLNARVQADVRRSLGA